MVVVRSLAFGICSHFWSKLLAKKGRLMIISLFFVLDNFFLLFCFFWNPNSSNVYYINVMVFAFSGVTISLNQLQISCIAINWSHFKASLYPWAGWDWPQIIYLLNPSILSKPKTSFLTILDEKKISKKFEIFMGSTSGSVKMTLFDTWPTSTTCTFGENLIVEALRPA